MRIVGLTVIIMCLAAFADAADNWPEFRGPQGLGASDATGLPAEFGEDKNIAWKTPIHGKGWSSPVVWGHQIWLTTATEDGHQQFGVCVDLESGKIIHDLLLYENENPDFCHPTNSYASPTPVIEEGRVYLHFGKYGTVCLDTKTGKKLWERRDFACNHFRGPGSSPILFGDLLFVNFDGFDYQYVVALNKNTGETVWRRDRNIDYGTDNGDMKKAYGTPTIVEYGGRVQLVSPAAIATIAYDPATGEELWQIQHGGMNVGARPMFGHGLVFISAGSGPTSLVAVRPDGEGNVTNSHVAWNSGQTVPKRSSQVLVDDLLFMISDNGVASCREATTGEILWQKRFDGDYWASPIYADGRVYAFSKDGNIPVFEASREFKLLAENQLDAGFNASPAVVEKALILRTNTHLYRIEKR